MTLRAAPDPPLTTRGRLRWAVVEPTLRALAPRSVAELGCGQGAVGARIAQHADYVGAEPDAASYAVAVGRVERSGGAVVHGDHTALPTGATYDVVCAFEVLEHLADDRAVLAEWVELVRPGGHAVFSVPEGPERFGASDTLVGHYRRYTPQSLRDLLHGAGLVEVEVRSYGWPLGYALEAVSNRVARRRLEGLEAGDEPGHGHGNGHGEAEDRSAESGRYLQPGAVVGALLNVGVRPFTLLQRLAPGRGSGLVATARRPV